jgi:hypothetical protein
VTAVRRYELPNLLALNFVLDDALEGGVNAALALDSHGKTASFRLLSLEIDVPTGLLNETAADNRQIKQKMGGLT